MKDINIAVKELARFVCSSGDLTVEFFSNRDLEEGTHAHDYLQSRYSDTDSAEYYVKAPIQVGDKTYKLHGFIDGVLRGKNKVILEEIKSTNQDLDFITLDYHKEYLAQLKIYGYLYGILNNLDTLNLRLTYISLVDYDIKSFNLSLSLEELEEFTLQALEEYIKWIDLIEDAKNKKEKSIEEIKFPFKAFRSGQRDLMANVFKAFKNNEILYTIAPTGIGKTMATLFSGLKTLGKMDKLFYLTAKGSGKKPVVDALNILKNDGLSIKSIDITAKRKCCNMKAKHCNPDECPFALGYFDRLKDATEEIFKTKDIFSYEVIQEVSNKHKICAFEFSLYLSYFCDVIIADYNYVFDPKAHLVRYFDDDTYNPKVLVDEAHNLVSRSREMYSAILNNIDLITLRKLLTGYKPSIRRDINSALEVIDSFMEYLKEKALYASTTDNKELIEHLRKVNLKVDEIIETNKKNKSKIEKKDEILEIYFKIRDFISVSEMFGENHRYLVKLKDDIIELEYYCIDASKYILDTINTSIKGIVFFSATLYPIDYYMQMLSQGNGRFMSVLSPFDPKNLNILINNKISTKYKDRLESIDTIIEAIEVMVKKKGNYIVFFPSYSYMKSVTSLLSDVDYEMIVQEANMTDTDREQVIERFNDTKNTKVGFFVMGGAFSEGIDFIGNALNGVIIVGVGLPLICDENNISKDFFEEKYGKGFEYAYMYPGFTKVIQAVGRVIRTDTDRGIAILIDTRFTYRDYLELMPPHWQRKNVISNTYELRKEINEFYNEEV